MLWYGYMGKRMLDKENILMAILQNVNSLIELTNREVSKVALSQIW